MNINRTTFLVDGFNLYHSLKQASHELGGQTTRWLNLDSLCKDYLYRVGSNAQLESIFYFSALAHHLTPQDKYLVKRHQDYISCLKSVGVTVELGRFKKKLVRCRHCGQTTVHHEEKETDVAIALKLFELLMNNDCDTIVLLTGDTDLAPAFRNAKRLFPTKQVLFAFPYKRRNFELQKLATSFEISRDAYLKHQFPNQVTLQNGKLITKPPAW